MDNYLSIHHVKKITITIQTQPLESGAYTIDFTFEGDNGITNVTTFSEKQIKIEKTAYK